MKSMIVKIIDHGVEYDELAFVCPGCEQLLDLGHGLHMLPVNTDKKTPSWTWDGNLEMPTLSPSILSRYNDQEVCHSFLRNGVFEFLPDCTHRLAGQQVPMPELYEWFVLDMEGDEPG